MWLKWPSQHRLLDPFIPFGGHGKGIHMGWMSHQFIALRKHLWARYHRQGYLGRALKVFWRLPSTFMFCPPWGFEPRTLRSSVQSPTERAATALLVNSPSDFLPTLSGRGHMGYCRVTH